MVKRYENKLFSVLGDSISTLSGYSEPGDAVYYEGMRKIEAEVYDPEDTWWGQVIERLGGKLLVNNSFSGSAVCKHPDCTYPSFGCSEERTSALCQSDTKPDVIMIFMGTNDRGLGFPPTPESEWQQRDLAVFSVAYSTMLERVEKNYPGAELWCFTLPVSIRSNKPDFVFPYSYGKWHIDDYCEVIRACAAARGCRVIDLYRADIPHDTVDGLHPNAEGMKTLADAVLACLG